MTDEKDVSSESTLVEPVPPPIPRLASSSAYQFAALVFALGANFIGSILIARTLGPTGKGQLSLLQQVPAILAIALNLGVGAANTYFVGHRKTSAEVALGNSLLVAISAALVGVPLVLLLTIGPLSVVENLPLAGAVVACLLLPVTLMASYVAAIGVGLGKIKRVSLAQVAGSAVSLITLLALWSTGSLVVSLAMLATLSSGVVGLTLNLTSFHTDWSSVRVNLAALRRATGYSLRSYLANLAGYLSYRQDILLVGYLAGAAAVGVYSIAVTFAELLWYIPNSISAPVLAKSIALPEAEGIDLATRTNRMALLLMAAIGIVAAIVIGPVISLVYTPAFLAARDAFLILIPGTLALGIVKILSAFLAARGKLYPTISIIAAVGNLLGNLVLVPRFGINGAALASALSYSFTGAAYVYLFHTVTGASLRRILVPGRADAVAAVESSRDYARALRRPSI